MVQHCPRERDPMTRSEGREDSGTRITLPVHLQWGGSAQSSWSAFHSLKGRVFRRGFGRVSGMWWFCASARSSARLKSFPQGPGQSQGKVRGSACVGFLLSFTARGWMEIVMSGCKKHCIPSTPVNRVAWGRYLCFTKDRRGRWRFRLGTKIRIGRPG